MKIRLTFFLLSAIFLFSSLSAERKTVKIAYGTPERCFAKISYPDDSLSHPVVVWFHGGGLTKGKAKIPSELLDTDYVIVSAEYRLLPKVKIDTCIDDAARAISWVFNNITQYGGDPSKIFISGHSAGGYLASMVGLDKSRLAIYNIDADSIRGIIPFSGQAITHYEWRKIDKGLSPLQATIDEHAPLYYVRPDAPPYIIITGDRELELYGRYEENAYLWRMLKLIGHPYVEIYELDGHNHSEMVHPAYHILKTQIKKILEMKN